MEGQSTDQGKKVALIALALASLGILIAVTATMTTTRPVDEKDRTAMQQAAKQQRSIQRSMSHNVH